MIMDNNPKIEIMKGFAKTIGTNTLTILLHEYNGRTEEAEILKKENEKLEDIIRRLITLYYWGLENE